MDGITPGPTPSRAQIQARETAAQAERWWWTSRVQQVVVRLRLPSIGEPELTAKAIADSLTALVQARNA